MAMLDGAIDVDGEVIFPPEEDGGGLEDADVPPPFDGGGGVDADVPRDAGPRDAGPRDAGPRDAGRPDAPSTCAPATDRLAIVEVMIASQAGTDRGEWFEIRNTGTCAVDLSGLVLESPTSSGSVPVTHTMTAGVVAPGDHFVLALSGDTTDNHGLPHDYVYGTGTTSADVLFNNTGDELAISFGGVEIDRVVWPSEGFVRGMSRQFPRDLPVAMNADWAHWCDATAVFSTIAGTSYFGTPGATNGLCP
jgi:hypothetical protein